MECVLWSRIALLTLVQHQPGFRRMSSSDRLEQLKQEVTVHAGPSQAGSRAADARDNRGRSADMPTQIPLPGWKDVALRSYYVINESNIFLVAGGVTYALLLALFPAL